MTRKEYVKMKANDMAKFLGFNVEKPNLTVINALEMFCQGYEQAMQDQKDEVAFKPTGIHQEHVYDDENPDYIKGSEDGI